MIILDDDANIYDPAAERAGHNAEAITRLVRVHKYLFDQFLRSRDRKRTDAVADASGIVWERLEAIRALVA